MRSSDDVKRRINVTKDKDLDSKFLSCVKNYIEDMAAFTALAKYSKFFCNTKVA